MSQFEVLFPGEMLVLCLSVPGVFSADRIAEDSGEEPGYHQYKGL